MRRHSGVVNMKTNVNCELDTTMWFQPGCCKNDTIVVLECPGKQEMLANRPAVGETGKNLCHLLCDLRKANVQDLCKRTVEIINASRVPHYKGATDGEKIKDKEEVEIYKEFAESRLMRDEITHILCFGKYAEILFDSMGNTIQNKVVICCPHIGRLGLADGKKCYTWSDAYSEMGVCQGRLKEVSDFIQKSWHIRQVHKFPKTTKNGTN